MTDQPHFSVMLNEVLRVLAPRDGGVYVDGTFGWGGYTSAILEAADCTVWAIDRDPTVCARADELSAKYAGRFSLLKGCYGDMQSLLAANDVTQVDGVALDIGVSSMQIDDAERGFSFRSDGPLDMRMSNSGESAADVVNEYGQDDLANIIYKYGEERVSRRIAGAIVRARAETEITRTSQLASIIHSVMPRPKKGQIDSATRTFQALRIHVNDELGEIARGLDAAEALLAPGGRLAVVSFHSLEDRIVKEFLHQRSGAKGRGSRHLPEVHGGPENSFTLLKRGAIKPTDEEVEINARSRSARLRAAERTAAPVWKKEAA